MNINEYQLKIFEIIDFILSTLSKTQDTEAMEVVSSVALKIRRIALCSNEKNWAVATATGIDLKEIAIFTMQYIDGEKSGNDARMLWKRLSFAKKLSTLLKDEPQNTQEQIQNYSLQSKELEQIFQKYCHVTLSSSFQKSMHEFVSTYDFLVDLSCQCSQTQETQAPEELKAVYEVLHNVLLRLVSCIHQDNLMDVKEAISSLNQLLQKSLDIIQNKPTVGENVFLILLIPTMVRLRIRKKISSILKEHQQKNEFSFPTLQLHRS
ncbi:MAG: hypothetical protein ACI86H_002258 [bacterium]|jgi:hypothetical protein